LTDSWKFPTEQIMGAQRFNFVIKCFLFTAPTLFFKMKFAMKRKLFSATTSLDGGIMYRHC